MHHNGNRIRIVSRKIVGKASQDLEIEWLWGNERERRVKGDSKILTFGDWDNVNTHQKDWKWIRLGSNIMLS